MGLCHLLPASSSLGLGTRLKMPERRRRPAGPGGRPGNPGRPPWCDCGRAGSGRGPPRRRSRCGGCSDTPWNSCGRRSRSGSGSGRAPHTSRSRNPGRTLGGTAPSRCGEGVGVRAGKQPPPPQGRPGWRQGPHSFSEPTRPPTLFSTSPPRPRSVPSLPCSWVQPRTSCGSDELPLQGTLSNQRTNLPSLDQVPTSRPPPHLGLWFLASCLSPCPILNCSSQALPLHGRSGLLPSTPPEPWSSRNLTCPWCSLPCSCTRNRGAGRGSSGSRCSHGARWHIRPPGGRKERPRRPQVAHTSALT